MGSVDISTSIFTLLRSIRRATRNPPSDVLAVDIVRLAESTPHGWFFRQNEPERFDDHKVNSIEEQMQRIQKDQRGNDDTEGADNHWIAHVGVETIHH